MTIETQFEIGQQVWPIENRHKQVWNICGACDGTGQVELKNGVRTCPECYGRRGNYRYEPTRWMLAEGRYDNGGLAHIAPLTIGLIRVQLGYQPETLLMMEETGVGSGSLWRGENVFLSESDALLECEKRNAEEETTHA